MSIISVTFHYVFLCSDVPNLWYSFSMSCFTPCPVLLRSQVGFPDSSPGAGLYLQTSARILQYQTVSPIQWCLARFWTGLNSPNKNHRQFLSWETGWSKPWLKPCVFFFFGGGGGTLSLDTSSYLSIRLEQIHKCVVPFVLRLGNVARQQHAAIVTAEGKDGIGMSCSDA